MGSIYTGGGEGPEGRERADNHRARSSPGRCLQKCGLTVKATELTDGSNVNDCNAAATIAALREEFENGDSDDDEVNNAK